MFSRQFDLIYFQGGEVEEAPGSPPTSEVNLTLHSQKEVMQEVMEGQPFGNIILVRDAQL